MSQVSSAISNRTRPATRREIMEELQALQKISRLEAYTQFQSTILKDLQTLPKAEVKAKINEPYKQFNGGTILHLAAALGMDILVRHLIEDYGADVNAVDNDNNSPLHLALENAPENDGALQRTIMSKRS